jgi:hypothetical protein
VWPSPDLIRQLSRAPTPIKLVGYAKRGVPALGPVRLAGAQWALSDIPSRAGAGTCGIYEVQISISGSIFDIGCGNTAAQPDTLRTVSSVISFGADRTK